MTTEHSRLDGIEAARGIAASVVVLYHVARHLDSAHGVPTLARVFQFGHAGVDLFFVISGFIILFVHYDDIGRRDRVARYLGRRFTRLMPTYWVALSLTVALNMAGRSGFPPALDLFWSAALLPSHHEPIVGVAWTLQYEIVFYAMFCSIILNRVAGLAAFTLWLGVVLTSLGGPDIGDLPGSLYGPYNLEFFFGMGVAYWLKNHSVSAPRLIFAVGLMLFLGAALAEDISLIDGYVGWGRLVYGPAAALIVMGIAEASRRGQLTIPAVLGILGSASYSIYLFQFVFIGVLWKLWLMTGLAALVPHTASFPLLVIAAVAGGTAVSRWVEYPLMRLVRRRRRTAPAAATST